MSDKETPLPSPEAESSNLVPASPRKYYITQLKAEHDAEGHISEVPHSMEVEVDRILHLLQTGDIENSYGRMRWSSNFTALVSVKDEELETLAIYKPQRGERPLWDFPEGTLCQREMAAYEVSVALGWDLVAPTILRAGPHGLGSVQLFVEHDHEINYFTLDDSFNDQLKRLAAFDCVVNNTDRKGGHCLVDPRGKLWGIDHGICFHSQPKLRTVVWNFAGQRIPARLLKDISRFLEQLENPTSDLLQKICPLLSNREIEALRRRTRQLLDSRRFPHPGAGPSYPWPPI